MITTGRVITEDGAAIAWRRVDAPDPRGHVLILQGRGDFIAKYDDAARRLRAAGLSSLTWDWRGQGDSDAAGSAVPVGAGHVRDFDDYLDDMDAVLEAHPDLPGPRALLAHSMGGLLAMLHLAREAEDAAAAVLLAPMLAFRGAPPLPILRAVSGAAVALGQGERWAAGERWTPPRECTLRDNMATSDPDGFEALQRLRTARRTGIVTGSTWGWARAAGRAMHRVRTADLSAVSARVLVASIPEDPTVDARAHAELVDRLPAGSLREYEGRHDLLWEAAATVERLWLDVLAHLVPLGDGTLGRRDRA